MLTDAVDIAKQAGNALLRTFGEVTEARSKGDTSNVVTDADTCAEGIITAAIRRKYPNHSIIGEETGAALGASDYTWVVDPLDGTSNYAAGIPWFGVLICVFRQDIPIAAVAHLPATSETYVAERGGGTYRNGTRVSVTQERRLSNVLWAYGMDGGASDEEAGRNVAMLSRLLRRVRNVRATNSLVDPAYVADGRLGGMLNQSTRIWDIAAPMLLVQEAGGLYTDSRGLALTLDLSASAPEREYAVLAAAPSLHAEVVELMLSQSRGEA